MTTDPLDEVLAARERRRQRFLVEWDEAKKPPKPILPAIADHDDFFAQAGWLTAVLHLSQERPIIRGVHAGLVGGSGHITFERLGTDSLEFKPASRMANAQALAADLVWQLHDEDGEPYPWSNQQAVRIARMVRRFCDASAARTSRQQTAHLIHTYLEASEEASGNTYGTTGERYDAAVALRPVVNEHGRPLKTRYLTEDHVDEHGELHVVLSIRVSDLAILARQLESTIAHGWLDAQMEAFGWKRVVLQGQSIGGREGRVQGQHARCDVYRGLLTTVYPPESDVDEGVNT